MGYADELLDGFNEMLADFGTTITLVEGDGTPIPVLAVFPDASEETQDAGEQPTGSFNFQVARSAAAGIVEKAHFTVPNLPGAYTVGTLEDDGVSPLLYVSAEVFQ